MRKEAINFPTTVRVVLAYLISSQLQHYLVKAVRKTRYAKHF